LVFADLAVLIVLSHFVIVACRRESAIGRSPLAGDGDGQAAFGRER